MADGSITPAPMTTDTRVYTARGTVLAGEARLPEVDAKPAPTPFFDRVGYLVRENPLLLAGAGTAGLVAGTALPSGILRRVLGGGVGLGLGVLGALAVGAASSAIGGRWSSDSDAFVRDTGATPGTARRGEAGEHVRVLQWNVRELVGPDGDQHFRSGDAASDAIKDVVEREHPDVLVLQEVSIGSPLGGMRDNLQELADRLGASGAVLVPAGMRGSGRAKGQAVFTFGDAKLQDARALVHADPNGSGVVQRIKGAPNPLSAVGVELPGWVPPLYTPRVSADVIVTTAGGTDVRVLDEHLSGTGVHTGGTPGSTERIDEQLGPVAATLDAWDGPTILGGDFNTSGSGDEVLREAQLLRDGGGLRDALVAAGVPLGDPRSFSLGALDPYKGVDRTYVSDDFRVTGSRVLRDERAVAGSDHLPVLTDLVVK